MADIKKVEEILLDVTERSPAGFAIAFHIRLMAPDFLFQTYPKNWIDLYSEKGWVMADPIVRWGFTETGHIRWSDLGGLDDQGILEQSAKYGMSYGLAIATEEGGSRSVAGFSRNDREFTDDEIAVLARDVEDLHAATASTNGMGADVRGALHDLSVKMTHPPTTLG